MRIKPRTCFTVSKVRISENGKEVNSYWQFAPQLEFTYLEIENNDNNKSVGPQYLHAHNWEDTLDLMSHLKNVAGEFAVFTSIVRQR